MTRPRSPASRSKLRRWIDLVAALLGHHRALSLEELRDEVPDYGRQRSKATLRRMFERDKDELRALGIPLETVTHDELTGYRLRGADFYLPYLATVVDGHTRSPKHVDRDGYRALTTLTFEPDEVEALHRAVERVRALKLPDLSADADRAVRKLALDLPALETAPDGRPPADGGVESAAFPPLMEALVQRQRVTFTYYAIGHDQSSIRTTRPYGLFFLNAHWYLAAVDDAEPLGPVKNFRLSRISNARPLGTSRNRPQYEIPASFDITAHSRDKKPWELTDAAATRVEVDFSTGDGAAAAGARLGAEVPDHPGRRSFAVRRVDAFVRWLLSFAGSARPVSPPPVVEAFRAEARAVGRLYAGDADG
ncbi:MAG TPA: WYL domain-containing protein [Gemmatimonadales bacterium]|nr:WYL domain-containing protein [Gemmatimonadales bacterium]